MFLNEALRAKCDEETVDIHYNRVLEIEEKIEAMVSNKVEYTIKELVGLRKEAERLISGIAEFKKSILSEE